MCRLLGIVTDAATSHTFALRQARRSLAVLSQEHPDGWGLALHARDRGWLRFRNPRCASQDPAFARAAGTTGELLLAHVRKMTVGPQRRANTHPFRRGRWAFAHNGTLHDLPALARRTSAARIAEVEGDTDSERYFAHLLTALDEAGGDAAMEQRALLGATRALVAAPPFGRDGGANFLLGDGQTLYAFRLGRPLFLLDRGTLARGRRRPAILVATEPLTDERWSEVPEGALVSLTASALPRVERLTPG